MIRNYVKVWEEKPPVENHKCVVCKFELRCRLCWLNLSSPTAAYCSTQGISAGNPYACMFTMEKIYGKLKDVLQSYASVEGSTRA